MSGSGVGVTCTSNTSPSAVPAAASSRPPRAVGSSEPPPDPRPRPPRRLRRRPSGGVSSSPSDVVAADDGWSEADTRYVPLRGSVSSEMPALSADPSRNLLNDENPRAFSSNAGSFRRMASFTTLASGRSTPSR